jgi:hypothetical protein
MKYSKHSLENYRRHLQNNNLIGFVLGLAACALALIIIIIAHALSR